MRVWTQSGAPAPVAPLPSRELPRSVHFSVAIDNLFRPPPYQFTQPHSIHTSRSATLRASAPSFEAIPTCLALPRTTLTPRPALPFERTQA